MRPVPSAPREQDGIGRTTARCSLRPGRESREGFYAPCAPTHRASRVDPEGRKDRPLITYEEFRHRWIDEVNDKLRRRGHKDGNRNGEVLQRLEVASVCGMAGSAAGSHDGSRSRRARGWLWDAEGREPGPG